MWPNGGPNRDRKQRQVNETVEFAASQKGIVGVKSPLHSLTQVRQFSMSVNAFHEKAGGSQGDSFWYLLVTRFVLRRVATVATLPSALFDERFGALGASWVFSFQPVLPSVYRPRFHLQDESWARRLTQSPELGFGFSFRRAFLGFMQPPASLLACDCATVRKPLRSPTGDATRRPAFAPLQ